MSQITAQTLVYSIRQITQDIDPSNQRFRLPRILAALDRGLIYLTGKIVTRPQVSSTFLTLAANTDTYALPVGDYQFLASFNYGKNGAPIRRESILVWQQYKSMNPNSIGQPLIIAFTEDPSTGAGTAYFWPKPFEIQTVWAISAVVPSSTFLGMAAQDLTTITVAIGPYGNLALQHYAAGDLLERENWPQSRGAGSRDLGLADEYKQMESNRIAFEQAGEGRLASVI